MKQSDKKPSNKTHSLQNRFLQSNVFYIMTSLAMAIALWLCYGYIT